MDIKTLKEIVKIFDNSKANVLELENEQFRIFLDKSVKAVPAQTPAPALVLEDTPKAVQKVEAKPECEEEGELIASPMVGTFYQAPSPDSPPYVRVGDKIKKGDTLCIIEAMKIMNELEAEFDCEIIDILVEDGQPVEFDTPLFKVKKL
ncbi:acetyl-CoA carboxylase biotin carboxyl carrier protein [Lebetimonas sp. JS032]|uniref:acetyl-CoA carboxylase biotin carboxyl carrier protein n=1 Tax=Lebetimonas sp. JS032 TaxID=990070 RepID=UPI0004671A49|nr:acetyl-CoA carboxylase biotin carboxyl carrier protein [Lebetimonas sp. JS032]